MHCWVLLSLESLSARICSLKTLFIPPQPNAPLTPSPPTENNLRKTLNYFNHEKFSKRAQTQNLRCPACIQARWSKFWALNPKTREVWATSLNWKKRRRLVELEQMQGPEEKNWTANWWKEMSQSTKTSAGERDRLKRQRFSKSRELEGDGEGRICPLDMRGVTETLKRFLSV